MILIRTENDMYFYSYIKSETFFSYILWNFSVA